MFFVVQVVLALTRQATLSRITHQIWHTIFHSADKTRQQKNKKKQWGFKLVSGQNLKKRW